MSPLLLVLCWRAAIILKHEEVMREFSELVEDVARNYVLHSTYEPVEAAQKVRDRLERPPVCKHLLTACAVCRLGNKKHWDVSYVLYYGGALK
jgi:hypothetical protein